VQPKTEKRPYLAGFLINHKHIAWSDKRCDKEFVVGRLINWSLSDKRIRIRVPIGIAYGSDTKLAQELLLQAARKNPHVLPKPAAEAVFKGFGDNSLDFELRVYINGIENWWSMQHELNISIDNTFKEAGVTIAFPQRDVHLDATGPLEVRVVSRRSGSEDDIRPSRAQKKPDSGLSYTESSRVSF
jgi:potassium efflux system protein